MDNVQLDNVQPDSFDLIAFDLDDTLAESKSALDPEMAALVCQLLMHKKMAVISGGAWPQFQKQVVSHLSCGEEQFKNLYLLPTQGTSLYEYREGWIQTYQETTSMTVEERKGIFEALEKAFMEKMPDGQTVFQQPVHIYGVQIEDRVSQVTFSALGSEAPLELKRAWDPDLKKRRRIIQILAPLLPDFSINIGGTTSLDIVKKGLNKAHGIQSLATHLAMPLKRILYVGDALYAGGNDEPVISLGVPCYSVKSPEDTKKLIRQIVS